jgi:hypothetical protein
MKAPAGSGRRTPPLAVLALTAAAPREALGFPRGRVTCWKMICMLLAAAGGAFLAPGQASH